ncbi:MAG TPA: transketolase C-terminal domain-containing protein [Acidimicrobiales bacterium]|nr:transketolase C-terminal domain-containing protein [Acidimicrobiales bacterium]
MGDGRGTTGGIEGGVDAAVLDRIATRVLWLAVRMVDYANHERPKPDALKVGGHQASSASMVSLMTALWCGFLRRDDRVSVKPHASPVLHALHYLLGNLEPRYLTELRAYGGLQSYPSRTKDPDPVDYSTGSVGLGAVAPIFGAVTERYVRHHFGAGGGGTQGGSRVSGEGSGVAPSAGRFVSLVGDAELDEGNVWEAMSDPVVQGLSNVLWVVDLNRQSLDRVVPGVKAARLAKLFEANDWQVVEAKYGTRLQERFAAPGGDALRRHIDEMANEDYQALFTIPLGQLRDRFLSGGDAAVKRAIEDVPDAELRAVLTDLGGHDMRELLHAFHAVKGDRPAVVLAYTVKGWGLPIAGDRLNHAALLTDMQVDELRRASGLDRAHEWDRFDPSSVEGRLLDGVRARLARPRPARRDLSGGVPESTSARIAQVTSTQEAFGRSLAELARESSVAARIVTASPDVTISTNLGGWVNRVGVFAPVARSEPDGENQLLRWSQGLSGQHLELDLSEMNLFLLLGQLGVAAETFGEPLVPIGTVYDPFVLRGLDAFVYSLYSGARFVVVGTPAGVALGYEGGAHQSIITPSVGTELPGVTFRELAFGTAVDWTLCEAIRAVLAPDGGSTYLRLSTRPVDQSPFERLREQVGDDRLRSDVLAGGYRLVDGAARVPGGPVVHLVGCGTVLPEMLEAAELLAEEGVAANVVDVTSVDLLYRSWRAALVAAVDAAGEAPPPAHLDRLFPPGQRGAPLVTVHDGAPHTLSWLGSVHGVPVVPLGVDAFGQVGSVGDLFGHFRLDAPAIVNAALVALDRGTPEG